MATIEANFDGIVGPTHHYAGLGAGNLASQRHRGSVSNPRAAALQGLAKMRMVAGMGVAQGVLPPAPRPDLGVLRRLGFGGTVEQMLRGAREADENILAAVWSASAMWAANAATVSASADTADGRVHFTPANMLSQLHRSIEAESTGAVLKTIFADEMRFTHHTPLPAAMQFGDEGAANHTRLCMEHGGAGVEVFVYGRGEGTKARRHEGTKGVRVQGSGFRVQEEGAAGGEHANVERRTSNIERRMGENANVEHRMGARREEKGTQLFWARQTYEGSAAVARLHGLERSRTMFVRQNPVAIDTGVFHNDVIAVGNRNVLLCHEDAFADQVRVLEELRRTFRRVCGAELVTIVVGREDVPLAEAVRTYLFNSQLLDRSGGAMVLLSPAECEADERVRHCIGRIVAGGTPIREARFVDVRQSMQNGGGPACLRLRVVLNEEERAAVRAGVWWTEELGRELERWVAGHYRERVAAEDLADAKFAEEAMGAWEGIVRILGMGDALGRLMG